jgi:glycosyltransferase involved in cell wall biosynthesis
MNKLKVVWICHFSNAEIKAILELNKRIKYNEFAPWISNLIYEFNKFNDIELYIIAPHRGMKKMLQHFLIDNINYYFFNPYMPFIGRAWPRFFQIDKWSGFKLNKCLVRKVVQKIKPDIIHMFGAENPYYSATILDLLEFPVLLTIQGIYSNPERFKYMPQEKYRYKLERNIHSKIKYFLIGANFFPALIKRDSENPVFFDARLPIKQLSIDTDSSSEKKIYDFVFWARMTKLKGAEDLLDALAIIKKQNPDVKLRMMGACRTDYFEFLKIKISELDLCDNIVITGDAIESHEALLEEGLKGKIYVLPTFLDTIPGTIVEAIKLGLPVISYNVGDIPLFNKEKERILLCDPGDISALAANMLLLLTDSSKCKMLADLAKEFVGKEFNNTKNSYKIVTIYHAILDHINLRKQIPEELLYKS